MPAIDYRNKQGKRIQSVTTILDVLAKNALVPWAYKRGIAGIPLYESRDKAIDSGTFTHLMIEHHLKGLPEPSPNGIHPEVLNRSKSCFAAFLSWEKTHSFKMVASEHSLVSEQYQYGGTIDIGAIVNGLGIVDIKTSPDIYFAMKVQVAAYGHLWNENYPDKLIAGYHILRLGNRGDFSHHYWPNLDKEFEAFQACLTISKILEETEQRL